MILKREKQMTFANTGFERYSRQTKRAVFLDEMNAIVPWKRLCALIAPHYPTGEGGRPPIPLERMLRIYFLQQWFNLSDPGVEEALYDMVSMRTFAGIDLGDAPVPDETTVCKFRYLLEENNLGPAILREVNQFLASRKVKISTGTTVDATIIEAPSSTKNSSGERDPEMRGGLHAASFLAWEEPFQANSANRIVRSRVCVRVLSMSSTFSSASLALQKFAIVDLRKTRIVWP